MEKYIRSDSRERSLVDYKFFYFNGKIYCLYMMSGRTTELKMDIHCSEFRLINVFVRYAQRMQEIIPIPKDYIEMYEIAKGVFQNFCI